MPKIVIITDSDASLSNEIAENYKIKVIPITIQFGEESYTAGVDIDDKKLFEIIDERNQLPTTAAPSPDAFAKAFQQAFNEGADQIICICVSSKISATYQAALTAADMFPDQDITVVDSLNLCMAQGFSAIAAADAAKQGKTKEEILQIITDLLSRVHVYAALPTLKYLAMGGRMGKLTASVGETLNIKPVLTARDGKLELLEKVRTLKKAEARLIELACESAEGKEIESIALIHVNNAEGVKALFAKLQDVLHFESKPLVLEFGAGLSVHAGSGVIGFVLVTK